MAISGIVASSLMWLVGDRSVDPLRRIARAAGAHRVVQARLTGGYQYAPCVVTLVSSALVNGLICNDTAPATWSQARSLSTLASELRATSTTAHDAVRRHAAGSWNTLWSNPDAAITNLQAAAALDPANARVQSDLGVALLQRAETKQDPASILDAYAANDSALVLDPELAEALFNRGVILEHLYLVDPATAAWRSYLGVDSQSAWAVEARQRIQDLEARRRTWTQARSRLDKAIGTGDSAAIREVVSQFPWAARDDVRSAFVRWGFLYPRDEHGADSLRRRARLLAHALRLTTRDAMWSAIVDGLDSLYRVQDRSGLQRMANAVVEYANGRAALDRISRDSATTWLERAANSVGTTSNPFGLLIAYELARTSYQRHDSTSYDRALTRFRSLLDVAPRDYRWLRALSARNVGFIEFVGARFDVASAAFSTATAEGADLREPVLDLRTRADAARLSAMLRGERHAWKDLYAGFRALPAFSDVAGEAQRLYSTAAVLSWRRFPRLAPLFQREFVRLTSPTDSVLMVSALTREAELLAREGQPAKAREGLRRVIAYAGGIQNDSIRALMLADADLVQGQVWLGERPDSAVRVLKAVAERYDDTRYRVQQARARLLLADAYVGVGALDSARVTFDQALQAIERSRAEIGSVEDRAQFLDQARPVIDTVVRFDLALGDTVGALDFTERMRARVLLEHAGRTKPNASRTDGSIRATMKSFDSATSVLSYAVLDGEIIAWLIRRDGVWMHRAPMSEDLRGLVERYVALITLQSNEAEAQSLSQTLYDLLIAPFESRIPDNSSLIIVPDKALHFLPFPSLFDGRRKRFLVQSYEVSVAPSVRLYSEAAARYTALGTVAAPSVLAVGNPAFDPAAYSLPNLPGAAREARAVAGHYDRRRVLVGSAATRSAFIEQARTATVIHVAAHGIVSPDAPLLSQLVLAPDSGGGASGALYARDLFTISLPVTRLAVLSGCRTADGELSGTEGVSSLARALFAAGVPAVVASLWAVEDQETESFFNAFHADLTRENAPAGALRRTQVEWIDRGDPWRTARTWAAFELFGAAGNKRPPSNTAETGPP
jgi:CHAT domain-containing protein